MENIELDKSNKDAEVMTPGDVERLEQDQTIKKKLSKKSKHKMVKSTSSNNEKENKKTWV